MKYEFVAVDFDGTLCENAFPEIGRPLTPVIEYVKRLAAEGSKIILYTCREDGTRKLLTEAVTFCNDHDIPLYAVNENPANPYAATYGTPAARKAYADLYIDDKAVSPERLFPPVVVVHAPAPEEREPLCRRIRELMGGQRHE